MESENTIYFYGHTLPYYEFSNFYYRDIVIDNQIYKTVEHYYQSNKFLPNHPEIADLIRSAKTPGECFKLSRKYCKYVTADWHETKKHEIMKQALLAKFTQHSDLKTILINTGDKILVEHTTKDKEWADGGDGTGKNLLGKYLMELRTALLATN
jgi:ribA/ribD-fused uncharacterized protein